MKLCRNKILTHPGKRVVLGIHSNSSGKDESYQSGHAWISIETESEILFLGLWPEGHVRSINKSENCTDVRINFEQRMNAAVSRYYSLDVGQIDRLNHFINIPKEWRLTYNCSNWATQLFREVIGVPISAVDIAIFSTPRKLGQKLVELERKRPSSRLNPQSRENVQTR